MASQPVNLGCYGASPEKEQREKKVSARTRLDSLRGGGLVLRFGEPRRRNVASELSVGQHLPPPGVPNS